MPVVATPMRTMVSSRAGFRPTLSLDFQVEIWDWTRHDLDALEGLRDEGAVYSSMTGYISGGLVEKAAAGDLLATAEKSIPVAKRLGIPRLNLHGTGLDPNGLPVVPVRRSPGRCGRPPHAPWSRWPSWGRSTK